MVEITEKVGKHDTISKVEFRGEPYPVWYRHFRELDEEGNPLTKGGKTTASIRIGDAETGTDITAEALCSDKDCFNKKMGRKISFGRLFKELRQTE